MKSYSIRNTFLLLYLFISTLSLLSSQDSGKEYVTIYDDQNEEIMGRSEARAILRSVCIDALRKSESLSAESPYRDNKTGLITAVVLDSEIERKLRSGEIKLQKRNQTIPIDDNGLLKYLHVIIYTYDMNGIEIEFSLEKPSQKLLSIINNYYSDNQEWKDPVINHYKDNYVLRIFKTENIFEPWNEEITYNEALLAATLLGDKNQWLWGIHNGNGFLERINN